MDIIKKLHPLERKVFPLIKTTTNLKEIIKGSKLEEVEVLRALQWLQTKRLITLKEEVKDIAVLDKNGKKAIEEGLPERRLLNILDDKLTLNEIKERVKLDEDELNVSLGLLRKKGAIKINKDEISLTAAGKKLKNKVMFEEEFIKKLPKNIAKLSNDDRLVLDQLRKRKQFIKLEEEKSYIINLTEEGNKLSIDKIDEDVIENLTSDIIISGSWKGKAFRAYDIQSFAPQLFSGKRHFVNQAIDYIRRIWLDMGFKEMEGPLIQTSFWNFDALFTPQDHPARELQDTFFIKDLKGDLPKDERISNKVKAVHETGWTTGSSGWQYKWDKEEAKKLVLRTHTTCLSVNTIAKLKESDLPAKFFSVGRVFRNETIDYKHLFEFNQVEGIVVDPNANFKHLLGYLRQYYKKLGFDDVKFVPHYFPYTELSCESLVYDKEKGEWIEMGGAGIFRPEVVKPLIGFDVPVLAWGQGMERVIMRYYGINDLREMYSNDIKKLREIKYWMK